jgi:hydrogenase maturation protease
VQSGRKPGFVHRVDASRSPLPSVLRSSTSTHAVGVAEAIELARTLGRLPGRVIAYGIEGNRFEAGTELSPPVAAAVDLVAARVAREVASLAG